MAGNINTADLVAACKSLRAQHGMQEAAVDSHEKLPALDAVMRNIIADISGNSIDYDTIVDATANAVYQKMNGARLYKTNGDQLGVIGVVD
jgi:hypothetical protein